MSSRRGSFKTPLSVGCQGQQTAGAIFELTMKRHIRHDDIIIDILPTRRIAAIQQSCCRRTVTHSSGVARLGYDPSLHARHDKQNQNTPHTNGTGRHTRDNNISNIHDSPCRPCPDPRQTLFTFPPRPYLHTLTSAEASHRRSHIPQGRLAHADHLPSLSSWTPAMRA